jgi:hypothetical protein
LLLQQQQQQQQQLSCKLTFVDQVHSTVQNSSSSSSSCPASIAACTGLHHQSRPCCSLQEMSAQDIHVLLSPSWLDMRLQSHSVSIAKSLTELCTNHVCVPSLLCLCLQEKKKKAKQHKEKVAGHSSSDQGNQQQQQPVSSTHGKELAGEQLHLPRVNVSA